MCSLVETRAAVLPAPAFLGFCPGRWSNEGVAGNIIDVGGVAIVAVIRTVHSKTEIVAF